MQKHDGTISYIKRENILDAQTLQHIIEQQQATGDSIVSILKKSELVSEEQLTRIIAAANNIEFVNLSPESVEPMTAHMVTHEFCSRHSIIPLRKEADKLLVAMSAPLNLAVRDQIQVRTGCEVVPLAATPAAIRQAISYHFNVRSVTRQTIASMRLKKNADGREPVDTDFDSEYLRTTDDPITKLAYSIIIGAIDAKASDIHIEPSEPDMLVRYRIDGLLRDAIKVPASAQREVASHIKILAEMDISEKRVAQDGHITMKHNGHDYDLRVSSLPAVGGEKIVLRILDKSANKWSLDKIISSPHDNQTFRSLVENPYGMILLTGPTGCGKTTTLYSILQLLNTPEKNIVTVEDPVEYRLDGITQIQVQPVAGMTFSVALRSILRQDPDIILVGEIRDFETAEIAISAALTGHLVLSTLHTNDAAGAISRLTNLGIPPFLLSSALLGTAAQRLVRTICPECKEPYTPVSEEHQQLLPSEHRNGKVQLYKGTGCHKCYNTGYSGRKAIFEILCASSEIRNMITESADDDSIKKKAIDEGMKTLLRSGIEEVVSETTTLEELLRVVDMRA